MNHLYIIRHGQSNANASQTVSGVYDSPLSPLGQQQAIIAGQNARRFFAFDMVATSPLARARQTAELVAEGMHYPLKNIIIIEELRERNLGNIEGHPKSEVPNQYTANIEDIENIPGQESLDDFYRRLKMAYQRIQALDGTNILVVAHNGSGRMLQVVANNLSADQMHQQPRLENAIIRQIL